MHRQLRHNLEEPLERIAAALADLFPSEPHADGVLDVIGEAARSSCRFVQVRLCEFSHRRDREGGERGAQASVIELVRELEHPPAHDQPELSEDLPPLESKSQEAPGGHPDLRRLLLVDHPNELAPYFKTPIETATTSRLEVEIIQITVRVGLGAGPKEKLPLHLVHVGERRERRLAEPDNFWHRRRRAR
jgi:hypothetical protein